MSFNRITDTRTMRLQGQGDLLAPQDAIVSRWGQGKIYDVGIAHVEMEEDDYLDHEVVMQRSDDTDKSITSMPASPIFDDGPYTNTHRRSSSSWSLHSMFTAFSTSASSRRPSSRISRTDSLKTLAQITNFKALPQSILIRVIRHLRNIHEDPKSITCSACFNRDAFNLALVSRVWCRAVRNELYRSIHLDGPDQVSKGRNARTTCIKLLYRTLRLCPALASNIQELRIWNTQATLSEATISQISSIILLCPNLRLYNGSQPFYNHRTSTFHQALASRIHLRSHLWIITSAAKPIQPCDEFVRLHVRWEHMTTLALLCQRGAGLDRKYFNSLMLCLPALEKLSISGFSADSFDDTCLLALGSLKALRLADLPGISDQGLARFAGSLSQTQSLISLSLTGIDVSSLYTIARLLAKLPLEKLTLAQYRGITLPASDIVIQPFLASASLKHIHWDVPLGDTGVSTATTQLISSIQHNGFPALHTLRCPTDTPSGAIQALCQPLPLADQGPSIHSSQISGTTLRAVRLRAQARASIAQSESEDSQLGTAIKITVTDPAGIVQHESWACWLGYVGQDRRIKYLLTSDVGNWEQRRCLAEEGDMLGDVLERGSRCYGAAGGRPHVGQPRWTSGDLERLF